MDGLKGPVASGTCFYLKRESLFRKQGHTKCKDCNLLFRYSKCLRVRRLNNNLTLRYHAGNGITDLKGIFGHSNELIKRLQENEPCGPLVGDLSVLQKEANVVASCKYDSDTKWGKEASIITHQSQSQIQFP